MKENEFIARLERLESVMERLQEQMHHTIDDVYMMAVLLNQISHDLANKKMGLPIGDKMKWPLN